MDQLEQTVNPLEVLWTGVMFIGCIVTVFNWYDAEGDLNALRLSHLDGVLMIAALGERSDQIAIMIGLASGFLLGVFSMLSLPGRAPEGNPSLGAIWGPWLFILIAITLIYLSISKRRRRKSILQALRERTMEGLR